MSDKIKMMRKRRASRDKGECNNNNSLTMPKEKRRRTMEERIIAQLKSDLTDRMIKPIESPDGGLRSRSGRKINSNSSSNNQTIHEMMTPQQQSNARNKRKSQQNVKSVSTDEPISIDLCSELSSSSKSLAIITNIPSTEPDTEIINITATVNNTPQTDDNLNKNADIDKPQSPIDFEQDLKTYHLLKRTRTESIQIVDEVDLTSSTDGSEQGDKDDHANNKNVVDVDDEDDDDDKQMEPDSTSQIETDYTEIFEIIEMPTSTTGFDTVSMNDKPFSECTSDDCVIADLGDSDSTDNWHSGQIVWAALPAFWPATIVYCDDENAFRKDNQIHVKFLYDKGRHSWVNEKNAILPFRGQKDFLDICKLSANKRIKAYKVNAGKKWNTAILEANVLQCIKVPYRIDFYEEILMDSVHEIETELRTNRKKIDVRCDTPQTFDTAYSSMKQSSSPNSLSPTLNELDRIYDVDKNINNYLKSVELSRPEDLAEDELQLDEITSYGAINELPSTNCQIYCPLAKLVFDKLREDDQFVNHNIIANESKFTASLNELWTEMIKPATKSRLSRRSSIYSVASNSSGGTPKQTNRQRVLATKKAEAEAEAEKQNESINVDGIAPIENKKTKEEILREKQQKLNDQILNCCIKNHPANFLLKGLPKDPLCQCCLESGIVMKCAGKCNAYFHKKCLNIEILESNYNQILKKRLKSENDDDDNESICIVEENIEKLQCQFCTTKKENVCFVCTKSGTDCIQCCDKNCGKAYHIECLKYWQQHKIQYTNNEIKSFYCPRHACHTCLSPDIKSLCHSKESDKKLIKCMQCPGTYHRSSECIPAGSELLSETQLICARHQSTKTLKRINIDFCILCSKGGSLICCDTCANACHLDCLNVPIGDLFICEECESGRRPLYGEIVWCKYSQQYPWWPALTVPTPCIPDRVLASQKEPNQICIFFFGTHNYGWVSQTHIYLYQKGDGEWKSKKDKEKLKEAMDEAEQWMHRFEEILEKSSKTISNKPPRYRKIKTNRVLAKFKGSEYNECKCKPDDPAPCSIESNCYNAVLNFECDPELCPAKDRCQNQNFQRGERFAFQIKMTDSKGWGLFAKEEIPADQFLIEYMGEVIDSTEFDQRFNRAKANKDDNYYFLTIGQHLYIDAAIYGNEARFINHSCDPNVAPNKWSVFSNRQEQIRIGFFTLRTIMPGEEITFDYNWGTKNMKTVKECHCGSKKCRGHI